MLQFLRINNFLLFKKQEISFNGNFTAITGETGSGKSMLIKALRFVLGEKLDITDPLDVSVIAQFRLNQDNQNLIQILNENDIEIEDNEVILRRVLNSSNKGKAFINDVPVTLKYLKKVSEELVEFHSQHKQLEAFSQSNCLNIIDQFANENILLEEVSSFYQQITKLNADIEESLKEKHELEKNKEFIEHSFKEIEALNLQEGEELELIGKKKLFNDRIKIISAIEDLISAFGRDDGIIQKLVRSQRNLSKLEYSAELDEKIESTIFHLDELQAMAESKLRDFDSNDSIEDIEERLSKIKELSRKYRCTSDQLLNIGKEEQDKLSKLANIEQFIKEKTAKKDALLKEYFIKAEALSQKRKQAAKKLESRILKELQQLKLEQVEFKIEINSDELRPIHIKGIDQASFLIKTNKGFSFAGINEIASGGELSRIMLAFKVALAEINLKTTIIFDEIDSGTGGAVAQTIGNRMKKLAESNQIIAISHQPQVASKASQHLLAAKSTGTIAQTNINDLSFEEKTKEIARMLAGINITEPAMQAALSLIKEE
ncbi:MAG: DNA repair protein RecN [Rickettsiales bacterium]|jgi:DNA repair protein RecN (Recombination protein N)|nr:DNA repair protein RecN [Rickettsiales bacterium]